MMLIWLCWRFERTTDGGRRYKQISLLGKIDLDVKILDLAWSK